MKSSPWRVRGLFVAAVLAWFLVLPGWPKVFFALGIQHYLPFLDLYAILASNDAVTAGLDPYAPNPLDVLGRAHVYSHWWLHLRDLGFTREQVFGLGLALVTSFIVAALASLRPRRAREALLYFFIVGAPGVLLGLDRANNDLLIFVLLAPVVPCLLSDRAWLRWLPVPLVAVAAALKFYPAAAAFVLLLTGNRREVRARAVVMALVLGAVAIDAARDLAIVGPLIPRADGLTSFGAANLLRTFGLEGWADRAVIVAIVALTAGLVLRTRLFAEVRVTDVERGPWLSFALGSVLLTACFFLGTNYAYRWIFAIWMAPLLWSLPRDDRAPPDLRFLARVLRAALLFALWADSLGTAMLTAFSGKLDPPTVTRLARNYLLCEQPITWTLFLCQVVFLTHFARGAVNVLLGRATFAASAPSAR